MSINTPEKNIVKPHSWLEMTKKQSFQAAALAVKMIATGVDPMSKVYIRYFNDNDPNADIYALSEPLRPDHDFIGLKEQYYCLEHLANRMY